MYERFRQGCEAAMPYVFIAALIGLGYSAANHNVRDTFLFSLSSIGTLPFFHKAAWRTLQCD
jgi:hypothetical protein